MEWPTFSLEDWKPVSRPAAILVIHEAGHPLFGIIGGGAKTGFGYTLMVLGGTLFELIVPLVCAAYFFFRRESTGAAFCAFWFFENFLYIGSYMSDARTSALPLVGSGDSDWEVLFSQWNLLLQDTQIANATRTLGWLGMLASVALVRLPLLPALLAVARPRIVHARWRPPSRAHLRSCSGRLPSRAVLEHRPAARPETLLNRNQS